MTKRIGTAARSKARMRLGRSSQAGLQLELVECIVTAERKFLTVVLVLFYAGTAAGGTEVARQIAPATRREELGCRNYRRASWEAAQSRNSPDKLAERGGASAKEALREGRKVPRHTSVHPSPILLVHWLAGSLTQ